MNTALRLLPYVRRHWGGLGVVLGTMGLSVALEVLRPWPAKILVDHILGQEPVPAWLGRCMDFLPGPEGVEGFLLWVCVGTVVIFVLGAAMSLVSTVAAVTFGQRTAFDLGADLFRHLQRLSLLFHARRPLGDTVGRVTGDTGCVQLFLTGTCLPLLQAVLTLGSMFVIMWRLEPTLTLLTVAVAPFLAVLLRLFGRPMKRRSRFRRDLEGRLMSLVAQALSAIPVVQAYNREELEEDRFRRCAEDTVAAYRRSVLADMWFKLLVGTVTACGTAAIMWLGARYALRGQVTVGTVLVFLAYLAALYSPLSSVVFTASTWHAAAANADRVLEILDLTPDVSDRPGALDLSLKGHVRYEDVTFGYGLEPVLKGVRLEAKPGEVIAIVGPTGAGKTTLVNLLVRFFDPWSGRVTVDGRDIRDLQVRSLRRQVALVLQEPFLFPLSVAENLAYGRPDVTRAEVVAAAVAANADAFIRRLPEGYDTVIGERGATLSGGEKQRLSIARALLKDAPVLILDEPTSALDAGTESLLLSALERLMAGRTTLIIAHRLSTIRNADRILVLEGGEVVEQGRHDELLALGGLYAGLYRQQMEIARHEGRRERAAEQPGGFA
jgi:ATP-binding cassette subfamily B protein/subfamily B ATP-binding cassette protein MsbA